MNVTREDVVRVIAEARNASEDRMPGQTRSEWEADALIEAFPHLVGQVYDEQDETAYDAIGRAVGPSRTIYTVTGDWKELK